MKITKIKTTLGALGAPISVEMDTIVAKMRSPSTREVASRVAAVALRSRLAMEKGAPRYMLNDANHLPSLVFSTTFGHRTQQA